jgi:hypothetical protein
MKASSGAGFEILDVGRRGHVACEPTGFAAWPAERVSAPMVAPFGIGLGGVLGQLVGERTLPAGEAVQRWHVGSSPLPCAAPATGAGSGAPLP